MRTSPGVEPSFPRIQMLIAESVSTVSKLEAPAATEGGCASSADPPEATQPARSITAHRWKRRTTAPSLFNTLMPRMTLCCILNGSRIVGMKRWTIHDPWWQHHRTTLERGRTAAKGWEASRQMKCGAHRYVRPQMEFCQAGRRQLQPLARRPQGGILPQRSRRPSLPHDY